MNKKVWDFYITKLFWKKKEQNKKQSADLQVFPCLTLSEPTKHHADWTFYKHLILFQHINTNG